MVNSQKPPYTSFLTPSRPRDGDMTIRDLLLAGTILSALAPAATSIAVASESTSAVRIAQAAPAAKEDEDPKRQPPGRTRPPGQRPPGASQQGPGTPAPSQAQPPRSGPPAPGQAQPSRPAAPSAPTQAQP